MTRGGTGRGPKRTRKNPLIGGPRPKAASKPVKGKAAVAGAAANGSDNRLSKAGAGRSTMRSAQNDPSDSPVGPPAAGVAKAMNAAAIVLPKLRAVSLLRKTDNGAVTVPSGELAAAGTSCLMDEDDNSKRAQAPAAYVTIRVANDANNRKPLRIGAQSANIWPGRIGAGGRSETMGGGNRGPQNLHGRQAEKGVSPPTKLNSGSKPSIALRQGHGYRSRLNPLRGGEAASMSSGRMNPAANGRASRPSASAENGASRNPASNAAGSLNGSRSHRAVRQAVAPAKTVGSAAALVTSGESTKSEIETISRKLLTREILTLGFKRTKQNGASLANPSSQLSETALTLSEIEGGPIAGNNGNTAFHAGGGVAFALEADIASAEIGAPESRPNACDGGRPSGQATTGLIEETKPTTRPIAIDAAGAGLHESANLITERAVSEPTNLAPSLASDSPISMPIDSPSHANPMRPETGTGESDVCDEPGSGIVADQGAGPGTGTAKLEGNLDSLAAIPAVASGEMPAVQSLPSLPTAQTVPEVSSPAPHRKTVAPVGNAAESRLSTSSTKPKTAAGESAVGSGSRPDFIADQSVKFESTTAVLEANPVPELTGRSETEVASRDRSVELRADSSDFYDEEMIKLYWAIQRALPVGGSREKARGQNITSRIVEVISANPGAGASTVVRGLAETAFAFGSARVLVCRALFARNGLRVSSPQSGLDDVAAGRIPLSAAITPLSSGRAGHCDTASLRAGSRMAVDMGDLEPVFSMLREQYDLILIDAPAMSRSFMGSVLSKRADGVVLIVEAGRTRIPVALAARRQLELHGANILGVVLNKRRWYIPQFIYRFL